MYVPGETGQTIRTLLNEWRTNYRGEGKVTLKHNEGVLYKVEVSVDEEWNFTLKAPLTMGEIQVTRVVEDVADEEAIRDQIEGAYTDLLFEIIEVSPERKEAPLVLFYDDSETLIQDIFKYIITELDKMPKNYEIGPTGRGRKEGDRGKA